MTKVWRDRGYRDLDADPVVLADGTVLTNDRAAEWDLEIERRLKRGRPSIDAASPDEHPRSPQVSARVPRSLLDRLNARAAAEGKPTSEIIREALRAYVA